MEMELQDMSRKGMLLDVLSEMSSLERQIVVQAARPWTFLPDTLLDKWDALFGGGYGLSNEGFSEDILAILLEFDSQLESLIEILPADADDKVYYLHYDEVWRIVRELADWTLSRIAQASQPVAPELCLN